MPSISHLILHTLSAKFYASVSTFCYKKKALPGTPDSAYVVRVKGLEPLRRKTPDPKSGASAIPPHSHEYLSILS